MKNLQEQLRSQTENLEAIVQTRTAELRNALETRSRFLATMSHGNGVIFA